MYILVIIIFTLFGVLTFLYFRRRSRRKAKELKPYAYGKSTLYFTKDERIRFEAMSRASQRALVNRFNAQVKKGRFVPVYKDGKLEGYIENRKTKKNTKI